MDRRDQELVIKASQYKLCSCDFQNSGSTAMISVFVETPRGRDSAGFTVPESAAADDVLIALRSRGWSPSRYASTLSNTRGSPLCWTGGARLDVLAVERLAR
jgi:hypothetical protein